MKTALITLFSLTIFAFLGSQAIKAQSPSKVLKQAEKAIGGKKAFMSETARASTGRIMRRSDGVSGNYMLRIAKPNLLNIEYDLGGFEVESGYNGRSGWTRDSRDGLKTATDEKSILLQAMAEFQNNLWFNAKAQKAKLVAGGRSNVDGMQCNVVRMITAKGVELKMCFDTATGLLLRNEMSIGDEKLATQYGDYRDVGRTKAAYFQRMTVDDDDDDLEIILDEVVLNKPSEAADFDFPISTGSPLPDTRTLLAELQANEDKVEQLLENYAYTQKSIKRQMGKDGIVRETDSETYQLSFYKGNRIRRLIEKNGRPLNTKDQESEDKEVAKRIEEIERDLKKQDDAAGNRSSSGPPSEDSRRISIAEVLRASRLINPRRERYRGRQVIVFDFEPDPDFDFKNAKSMLKFFGKTTGVMWIDEQDKQVARVEATLADSYKIGGGVIAKLKKGASFTLEQERVNNEIWLPTQADINLSVRLFLVKGIDLDQVIKSYDYRRFETEVKDAQITGPDKP